MELDLDLIDKAKETLAQGGSAWDILTMLKATYTSTIPLILALRAVLPLGLQEAVRLAHAEPSQEADLRMLRLPRLLLFCHRGASGAGGVQPEGVSQAYRFFKEAAFEGHTWLTVVSAKTTEYGHTFEYWSLPEPSTNLSPAFGCISGSRMTMADLQAAFRWILSAEPFLAEHLAVVVETSERLTCRFQWP
jgi:hypothetical protein